MLRTALLCCLLALATGAEPDPEALFADVTRGALRVAAAGDAGQVVECPLASTEVVARISGMLARVEVVQVFRNPYDHAIEAVYVFPLPHQAAVDALELRIADRRIAGRILRRDDARRSYQAAIASGRSAALLEQERPNIFTQTVGNIPPGATVRIAIGFSDVLPYDDGAYSFHFPMVVGPRYNPGAPLAGPRDGAQVPAGTEVPAGAVPPPRPTDQVPDAQRITPPVLTPGRDNAHRLTLRVELDAGLPIGELQAGGHPATITRDADQRAVIVLDPAGVLPDRDFRLRYAVRGPELRTALLAHKPAAGADGWLLLALQPAQLTADLAVRPARDLCFLIDVSGSMSGAPLEQVRTTLAHFLDMTGPGDRVQIITFAGTTTPLFAGYRPVDDATRAQALAFNGALQGGGGTEMLAGITAALDTAGTEGRTRIVVLMTDGYIGNEDAIIAAVDERCGDGLRCWALGIGSSPNRHLIDGIARAGDGQGHVLDPDADARPLVADLMERLHRAQLADIRLDWGGLEVYERYPARLPDLWSGRPMTCLARYAGGGSGTVRLSGTVEGRPVAYDVPIDLPAVAADHAVLRQAWARGKIQSLLDQRLVGDGYELEAEATEVALEHHLVSPFTSLLAVDGEVVVPPSATPPRRMAVPVPLPAGVAFAGIFGNADRAALDAALDRLGIEAMTLDAGADDVFLGAGSGSHGMFASRSGGGKRRMLGRFGGSRGAHQAEAGMLGWRLPALRPAAAPVSATGPQHRLDGLGSAGQAEEATRLLATLPTAPLPTLAMPAVPAGGGRTERLERIATAKATLQQADDWRRARDNEPQRLRILLDQLWTAANEARDARRARPLAMALALLPGRQAVTGDRISSTIRGWSAPQAALAGLGVIEHCALDTALASVAAAAGLRADVPREALDDACALLRVPRLEVAWIDLGAATLDQAMDWLLAGTGLTWWTEDGALRVTSLRRCALDLPWSYAVGDLVMPLPAELPAVADAFALAYAQAQPAFESTLRTALGCAAGDGDAPPVASGWVRLLGDRLVVCGPPALHARAAALLAHLRSADAALPDGLATIPGLATLRQATLARGAAHAGRGVAEDAVLAAARCLVINDDEAWDLLAAGLHGEAAAAALARLRACWTDPPLAAGGHALALRYWRLRAIVARIAPRTGDAGLRALAELLLRHQPRVLEAGANGAGAAGAPAALVAWRDLATTSDAVPVAVVGDDADALMLSALAARAQGGEAWEGLRASIADNAARLALPPAALVALSRLAGRP